MEIIRALLINKKSLYIFLSRVVFVIILLFPFCGIGTGYTEPVFSITSDNEPLKEVLAKISKSSGYKIEITKGWENKPVTVSLKKITLEKGLREIMRMAGEPNYAVVVNDSIKKVEIRIFDGSSPGGKKGGSAYVGTKTDFRKREKATSEREFVDMDPGKQEDPPEIDIRHPDMGIIPPE